MSNEEEEVGVKHNNNNKQANNNNDPDSATTKNKVNKSEPLLPQDKHFLSSARQVIKTYERDTLQRRIKFEAPVRGTTPLAYKPIDKTVRDLITRFQDLPICGKTRKALREADYINMTDIQIGAIPHALAGRDILGAAKTGSGKTLAFLIPLLEKLWHNSWDKNSGVGALVISPTRELALQIFEVLKKIGKYHTFSAGLVIGGKDLKEERERIQFMNILICTPGRLLQHMDQTFGILWDDLQILVLDEADRILDLGFEETVNAIIDHLPRSRQTLLFSATQTKSVKDLGRLSLNQPEYVSTYDEDKLTTPAELGQNLMVVPLERKMDMLYSFISSHVYSKIIIFVSTCKMAKFIHESFSQMQLKVPLYALHGKVKQTRRFEIFHEFCEKKTGVLFATDIVARGLDFPAVNWVLQLDCPEDVKTYIHRIGRTARNGAIGDSLLFLLPSEEQGFTKLLQEAKIPFSKREYNNKLTYYSVQSRLESLLSEQPELKYLAQKAFITYFRNVFLQSNKEIFKVQELPADEFASSIGLIGAPKIKFGKSKVQKKNVDYSVLISMEEQKSSSSEGEPVEKKAPVKTRHERLMEKKNVSVFSEPYQKIIQRKNEEDDEIFSIKRADHTVDDDDGPEKVVDEKKEKQKEKYMMIARKTGVLPQKMKIKPNIISSKRVEFNEEGEIDVKNQPIPIEKVGISEHDIKSYKSKLKQELEQADMKDKKIAKEKLRERRLLKKELEQKLKLKEQEKKKRQHERAIADGSDIESEVEGGDEGDEDEDEFESENENSEDYSDNEGDNSENEGEDENNEYSENQESENEADNNEIQSEAEIEQEQQQQQQPQKHKHKLTKTKFNNKTSSKQQTEQEEERPTPQKQKQINNTNDDNFEQSSKKRPIDPTLEDEEQMALRILKSKKLS